MVYSSDRKPLKESRTVFVAGLAEMKLLEPNINSNTMKKSYRFTKAITFAVLFLLANSPSSAQLGKLARPVGMLKGDVASSDGTPLAGISVTILKGTERVTTTKSTPQGKFTMVLTPDATYRILVNETQYAYHEDTLVIPALEKYEEYGLHVILTRLHDGENFSLDDPVFLPQSSTIEGTGATRLDKIVDLLRHNLKLSVQVTVYPDAPIVTKKDAPQKALVDSRATAVRSYFLGKGIQASRFSVVSGTTVPPGRFALANVAAPAQMDERSSSSSKKKKKSPAPQKQGLVPQYVEIVAHLAS